MKVLQLKLRMSDKQALACTAQVKTMGQELLGHVEPSQKTSGTQRHAGKNSQSLALLHGAGLQPHAAAGHCRLLGSPSSAIHDVHLQCPAVDVLADDSSNIQRPPSTQQVLHSSCSGLLPE